MLTMLPGKLGIQPKYESDFFGSGILYKPDVAKTRVNQGLVKYIGAPCWKDSEDDTYYVDTANFKVGDWVMFSGYVGTLIVEEDEKTIIVPAEHVICKLAPEIVKIPGLYHRDLNTGEPFPATYVSALAFITQAVAESDWGRGTNLKDPLAERSLDR